MKYLVKNVLKSCLFLASLVGVFRFMLCLTKNSRQKVDRWNVIISSFVCGFSILFEAKSRANELVMYYIPRLLESLYRLFVQQGKVRPVKNGEIYAFACCMALIMYCYENEPEKLKPTFRGIITRFFGEN